MMLTNQQFLDFHSKRDGREYRTKKEIQVNLSGEALEKYLDDFYRYCKSERWPSHSTIENASEREFDRLTAKFPHKGALNPRDFHQGFTGGIEYMKTF